MAAGKSAVGRALAHRLGWDFVDVDARVEEQAGRSIAGIFRAEGEAEFRRREAEVAADALKATHVVVATGGGWAAAEGRLDELPEGTVSVWLQVGVGEAVRRAERDGATRPLLEGGDPAKRTAQLLSERRRFYERATVGVDTEGRSVDDVTIQEILHEYESGTGAE